MRFIFFTKTDWSESPRLRHQLAYLLKNAGHDVIFFQRPHYPGNKNSTGLLSVGNISIFRSHQLLHHKLRLHPVFHKANAIYEKWQISAILDDLKITDSDVIVNFNYDYYFLRELLPKNQLITIINDHHWSRALFGYESPLKWALIQTIKLSDHVLAVSEPLKLELETYCSVNIFYPWASHKYIRPDGKQTKRTMLFWGYINDRLDFDYLINLASKMQTHACELNISLVGPIECSQNLVNKLQSYSNVNFYPPSDLREIDLTDVFLGIIPYKSGVTGIDVTSLPNKALQLLSRGIPLAIAGMPNFIEKPFVYRMTKKTGLDIKKIKEAQSDFFNIQGEIQEYVDNNDTDARLKQFMAWVKQK
jgi:hypothetical protein